MVYCGPGDRLREDRIPRDTGTEVILAPLCNRENTVFKKDLWCEVYNTILEKS